MVTSIPRSTSAISLEVLRTDDGRLEGRARSGNSTTWHLFSGVLELLKVVEEILAVDALVASRDESKEPENE
jgi:hypothetical protein